MNYSLRLAHTVPLTTSAVSVAEGGDAVFELTLDKAPTAAVTINYSTSAGTAGGSDYTSAAGSVTFGAGQTKQFVTISTTADSTFEADETFTVTFTGSSLTASVTATGTIANDDVDLQAAPTAAYNTAKTAYDAAVTKAAASLAAATTAAEAVTAASAAKTAADTKAALTDAAALAAAKTAADAAAAAAVTAKTAADAAVVTKATALTAAIASGDAAAVNLASAEKIIAEAAAVTAATNVTTTAAAATAAATAATNAAADDAAATAAATALTTAVAASRAATTTAQTDAAAVVTAAAALSTAAAATSATADDAVASAAVTAAAASRDAANATSAPVAAADAAAGEAAKVATYDSALATYTAAATATSEALTAANAANAAYDTAAAAVSTLAAANEAITLAAASTTAANAAVTAAAAQTTAATALQAAAAATASTADNTVAAAAVAASATASTSAAAAVTGAASDASAAALVPATFAPSSTTLTTDTLVYTGGAGDDTYTGAAGVIDGITINANGGNDRLNLTLTVADDDGSAFQATGIETISLRSTGGTAGDAALIDIEMGDVSGLETLEFRRINDDIQVSNLQLLDTTIAMTNNATTADVVVEFETSVVSGTADTANVTIDTTTGGADLTINGVETVAVTVVGEDNDLNVDGDDLETVTVAGAGDLNMDVDASVTTFDASSSTGGVRVNFTAAADVTATGGSGNDVFSIGALLTADDVINGGDGTDTLILDNAGAALAAIPAGAQITNVETLRLEATDDSAVDAFTLNASRISFDTITIDVSDENDTYAITNYTDETINIVESANNAIDLLDVSFADATGTADSLTINVTNNDTTTALTVDDIASTGGGIEILRLVLNQGADIDDASDILVDDISIAADTLVIAGAADATLGTTGNLTIAEIDASASTGDLTLELGAATHDVTGGSGDDTIDFNANLTSADSVDGGAGDDTLVAALAAGTAAATLANIESATLEFGTAGATFSGVNADTALTSITIAAASDENVSLTSLKFAVATVTVSLTGSDDDTVTVGYAAGSNAAHELVIGQAAADVDLGAVTITGNVGALTITSNGDGDNDVASITANAATALTIVSEEIFTNEGALTATAALAVNLETDGGALTITGVQTLSNATTLVFNAADGNMTLTGAMDANDATSMTVTATDDFLQSGDFVSNADISVSLTATGISSSIRYDGVLDVDHATSINLTAATGGSVVVDDIELLGVDSDGDDITSSIVISATGVDTAGDGSTVTVSAINTAAATLDSITITSDADGTVNLTTGAANLTITEIDATASLGDLTINTSTLAAATEINTGSGTNIIRTEADTIDIVNLASSAGTDTIQIHQMAGAGDADEVSNFEAGADGDVLELDVLALNLGTVAVANANGDTLSSMFTVVIQDDADGAAVAMNAATNILRVTNTIADSTALIAALAVATGAGNVANNEDLLVLWTDGASTYLSVVTGNGAAWVDFDAALTLVELVGVDITDLTADNFTFI
jgi:hypothetical protein